MARYVATINGKRVKVQAGVGIIGVPPEETYVPWFTVNGEHWQRDYADFDNEYSPLECVEMACSFLESLGFTREDEPCQNQ